MKSEENVAGGEFTFEEYQEYAKGFRSYPSIGDCTLTYPILGLAGEAGEVSNKYKKVFRDNGGLLNNEQKIGLALELGDVLWYLAMIAEEMGMSLGSIARMNIDKLVKRKESGTINGSGNNR